MTIKKIGKRVFVYVRVSTQEQAREGYSIGEQIDRLKKYCEAHGWIIVKIYTDAGYSGGDTDRPALQDMLKDVRAGKGDSVLVYKLDRLSRSQKDTLELIEDHFIGNNVDFVSMNENFDTATPFGRAMIGILAVFAQLEREQIKERMSMGMEARIKEGKWRGGGMKPRGYEYINGELVINEFDAMLIREMFEMYNNGVSVNKIVEHLKAKGFEHKDKKIDSRNVNYMLNNQAYIGNMRFRGEWHKGNHDPIIDIDTFEKARQRTEQRKEIYPQGKKETSTYLGGFMFCKRCGARYSKFHSGQKQYGLTYKYGCASRHKKNKNAIKDPNCKNKNFKVDFLDNLIFNEIRKLAADPNYIPKMREEKAKTDENAKKIQVIEKEINNIENQISRFMDLYGKGRFTFEQLDKQIIPLEDQKHKLQEEISNLQIDEPEKLSEEDAIRLVTTFSEILDRGNLKEVREALECLIERIEIDDEEIDIHWNFV